MSVYYPGVHNFFVSVHVVADPKLVEESIVKNSIKLAFLEYFERTPNDGEVVVRAYEKKESAPSTSSNTARDAIALLQRWADCWPGLDTDTGLISDTKKYLAGVAQLHP